MPRRKGHASVVTGMRNQSDAAEREGEGAGPQVPVPSRRAAPVERGAVRRFESAFGRYRLQLAVTPPKITAEGFMVQGESLAVQFEGGALQVDGSTEDGARIIKLIQKSPRYGIGKDCWDADELEARVNEVAFETFMKGVDKNPELLEKLKARLQVRAGSKDFETGDAAPPAAQP
jgi:hypothetical protein